MRDKDAPRPNAGNIDDVLPDTPTGAAPATFPAACSPLQRPFEQPCLERLPPEACGSDSVQSRTRRPHDSTAPKRVDGLWICFFAMNRSTGSGVITPRLQSVLMDCGCASSQFLMAAEGGALQRCKCEQARVR